MDSYFIQVQPRDELTAIIDKIINTQADKVYILISENSRIAQSALNFRLIKREADALGKDVIIVSASSLVQNLALKSSLQVHLETPEFRQGAEGRRDEDLHPAKISDVFIGGSSNADLKVLPRASKPKPLLETTVKEKHTDIAEGEKDKAIAQFFSSRYLRPRLPLLKAPRIILARLPLERLRTLYNFRVAIFTLIGIAAILSAATFYYILPRAEVRIMPIVEEVILEMVLTGNTDIAQSDPEKFLVPVQIFEKTVALEKSAIASGEKEIRNKASGMIKVYNAYSSAPQNLVQNTRFVSEDGKLFRTAENIVVPGAEVEDGKILPSFTTVRVLASEPGEEYNIGPESFSIPGFKGTPKYLGFYGESDKAMDGGKIGTTKLITESDYNSARRELESELLALADDEVDLLLPQGLVIPEGAKDEVKVKITSSANIGDTANDFVFKGVATIRAFAISEGSVLDMLTEDFFERFPDKILLVSGTHPQYKISKTDFTKGTIAFTISVSRNVYSRVDPKEIIENIYGKSERDVREHLSGLKNIKGAKITFWPFWVKDMPNERMKIKVIVEGVPTP